VEKASGRLGRVSPTPSDSGEIAHFLHYNHTSLAEISSMSTNTACHVQPDLAVV
jgi:hypothetical protein